MGESVEVMVDTFALGNGKLGGFDVFLILNFT